MIIYHKPFRAILRGLTAFALIGGTGCAPQKTARVAVGAAPHAEHTAPKAMPAIAAATKVQALPDYAQAKESCRRGDYRKAAAILARLQGSPKLNDDQKEFCYKQEVICLGHVSKSAATARRAQRQSIGSANGGGSLTASPSQPLILSSAQSVDCGPRALQYAVAQLGLKRSVAQLRQSAGTNAGGTTLWGLKRACEGLGLKVDAVQAGRAALPSLNMPALAWTSGSHYIAVLSMQGAGENGTARVHDPNDLTEKTISQERLLQLSSGYLLTLRR